MRGVDGAADGARPERDEAYAELVCMETRRLALEADARAGDAEARRALSELRPRLARQAVLAADLDRAADLDGSGDLDGTGDSADRPLLGERRAEARLAALCAQRLGLARRIEDQVEALAAACREMQDNADAFARAGLDLPPVAAELNRFRDHFRFYFEAMLDFVTGAKGLAGHPWYRRLAEVMLDGEAILKLYRRAAQARGGTSQERVAARRDCSH